MEESRGAHAQPDLAVRTSSNQGESQSFQVAECNSPYNFSLGLLEEEDHLAFEITEFFNAFQNGKHHIFMKLREKMDSLSPHSSIDSRGNQLGTISNAKLTDGQASFRKPGMSGGDNSTNSGIRVSAGQSGKWNGLLEVDSLSAHSSRPLTFSGPVSFSGHSGHVSCSGSVSHRSDSSTTSTHSFAFPILPCEWSSSPVKMPQPDQRLTDKGWKQCLCSFFCCAHSLNCCS